MELIKTIKLGKAQPLLSLSKPRTFKDKYSRRGLLDGVAELVDANSQIDKLVIGQNLPIQSFKNH